MLLIEPKVFVIDFALLHEPHCYGPIQHAEHESTI